MSALRIVILAAGHVLCCDGWETKASTLFFCHIGLILAGAIRIHDPIHSILIRIVGRRALVVIVSTITPHTGSPPCTATLTLGVPGKRVASCKSTITFWAHMWALASV